MSIPASCPSCSRSGSVPEPFLGKIVRCKRCNTSFKVGGVVVEAEKETVVEKAAIRHQWKQDAEWDADMPSLLVDLPGREETCRR